MSLPSFEHGAELTMEELRKRFGDRVRLERRRKSLTQKEFAEACGIALRTYKRFESGECDLRCTVNSGHVRFKQPAPLC